MKSRKEIFASSNARRAANRDQSVPISGAAKTDRIDLGLHLLSAVALPRVQYTQHELAAWCGCTTGAIYLMERRALRKLRHKFRAQFGLSWEQFINGNTSQFL